MRLSWMFYLYILGTYLMGAFLCLAPWSALWNTNYFLEWVGLEQASISGTIRGAISGLGAVNLIFALLALYELPRRSRMTTDSHQEDERGI